MVHVKHIQKEKIKLALLFIEMETLIEKKEYLKLNLV